MNIENSFSVAILTHTFLKIWFMQFFVQDLKEINKTIFALNLQNSHDTLIWYLRSSKPKMQVLQNN